MDARRKARRGTAITLAGPLVLLFLAVLAVVLTVGHDADGQGRRRGGRPFGDRNRVPDRARLEAEDYGPWTALPPGTVDGGWRASESAFGILDPWTRTVDADAATAAMKKLGVGWVRLSAPSTGGLNWGAIQWADGTWHWERADAAVSRAQKEGLTVLMTVQSAPPRPLARRGGPEEPRFPSDAAAYKRFVRQAAERYKGRVLYWQIGNEPDGARFWTDSPEAFARLVAETAPILKEVDPRNTVVLAGVLHPAYLERVVRELVRLAPGRRLVDAGDVHFFGPSAEVGRGEIRAVYRRIAALTGSCREIVRGTPYQGLELWVTETSTWDGHPQGTPASQSEEQQARDLVKRFTFAFATGVHRVFWTSVVEWTEWSGREEKFNYVGLVRNPQNGRGGGEKIALAAYRRLVERLRGFDRLERLEAPASVTALLFRTPRGPVLVAWYDRPLQGGPERVTVTLPVDSARVAVESALAPKVEAAGVARGSAEKLLTVRDRHVEVTLDDDPVYVLPARR